MNFLQHQPNFEGLAIAKTKSTIFVWRIRQTPNNPIEAVGKLGGNTVGGFRYIYIYIYIYVGMDTCSFFFWMERRPLTRLGEGGQCRWN